MILLALMAASLATSPVAAADKADLHCIAIFSMLASEMPEEKAGMTGAIMFYYRPDRRPRFGVLISIGSLTLRSRN